VVITLTACSLRSTDCAGHSLVLACLLECVPSLATLRKCCGCASVTRFENRSIKEKATHELLTIIVHVNKCFLLSCMFVLAIASIGPYAAGAPPSDLATCCALSSLLLHLVILDMACSNDSATPVIR
jgi:hypothetical protein